jgi:hypothetical protein
MTASNNLTGGCQCGAVRYTLLEKPHNPHLCHCRMCQKQFGGFYAALCSVPKDKFKITRGTMSNFRSSADVQRGFCRDCGTPLTYDPILRDAISISIGSLDNYESLKPDAQYGIEARVSWVDDLPALPAFVSGEDETGSGDFKTLLPAIVRSNRQHPDHDTAIWPPATHTTDS